MSNDINNGDASSGPVAATEDSSQEGGGSVPDAEGPEPEPTEPEPTETAESEEEPQSESSSVEKKEPEAKTEQPKKVAEKKTEKPKTKTEKKQEAKQKAASKIVKKMGDKGRYDDSNQLKTLVVMQVLGNTKTFFDNQAQLQDTPGFFDNKTIVDSIHISEEKLTPDSFEIFKQIKIDCIKNPYTVDKLYYLADIIRVMYNCYIRSRYYNNLKILLKQSFKTILGILNKNQCLNK